MNPYIVGLTLIASLRLWNVYRLWNIARFHGEGYCFDTPVDRDFYLSGAGLDLLRTYRLRLIHGLEAELVVAIAFFFLGGLSMAFWSLCVAAAAGGFYTTAVLKASAKEAWKHANSSEPARPAQRVVDLSRRTPSQYGSRTLVWAARLGNAAALVILTVGWARSREPLEWISLVVPGMVVYAQAGVALICRSLAEWRVCGIPAWCAEAALEWRDEARSYHIFIFQVLRLWLVVLLLVTAIQISFEESHSALRAFRTYAVWPLVIGTLALLAHRKRQLVAVAHTLRGASSRPAATELPDRSFHLGGLVYYDPEQPAMFVRRRNSFAINIAHPRSRLAVAYAASWILIVLVATRL